MTIMTLSKRTIAAATLFLCPWPLACASRAHNHPTADKPSTLLYVVRVVDAQSQAPVNEAKVRIELTNPKKPNWSGFTDAGGFFKFTWEANHDPVQAHISVEARGFAPFDQYSLLTPDNLIQLNRAN